MSVFDAKTGLQKLLWHSKLQTFFEMVSIFEFMRAEGKNFKKQFRGLALDRRNIADLNILGQKVGFSALCPGHTGPQLRKKMGFDQQTTRLTKL